MSFFICCFVFIIFFNCVNFFIFSSVKFLEFNRFVDNSFWIENCRRVFFFRYFCCYFIIFVFSFRILDFFSFIRVCSEWRLVVFVCEAAVFVCDGVSFVFCWVFRLDIFFFNWVRICFSNCFRFLYVVFKYEKDFWSFFSRFIFICFL